MPYMIQPTSFAERIKYLREAVGSVRALSRWFGMSDVGVSAWMSGTSKPLASKLRAVSNRTKISMDWLADGIGSAEKAQELAQAFASRENKTAASPLGKLRQAMDEAGLNAGELAKAIGYSSGLVRAVVDGEAPASESMIEQICKVLPSACKEDLMEGSDHPRVVREDGMEATYGSKPARPGERYVPLLSWAQAGRYSTTQSDGGYDYTAVRCRGNSDPRAFAVDIEGDSMEPKIGHGDEVIVSPSKEPRPGHVVLVKTNGEEVFCKLLQRMSGDTIVLASTNPSHPSFTLHRSEIAWIYPVTQVTHNFTS